MTHDGRVAEHALHVARAHARHALDVEIGERLAKRLALAQDGEPAQARLEAFEAQLLEQAPVVGDGESPLVVVVRDVERIVAAPGTPAIGARGGLACGD